MENSIPVESSPSPSQTVNNSSSAAGILPHPLKEVTFLSARAKVSPLPQDVPSSISSSDPVHGGNGSSVEGVDAAISSDNNDNDKRVTKNSRRHSVINVKMDVLDVDICMNRGKKSNKKEEEQGQSSNGNGYRVSFREDVALPSTKGAIIGDESLNNDESSCSHKNKRMRQLPSQNKCLSAINALNRAVARRDCITAITQACSLFDHNDKECHDFEIENGAHIALFKLLCIVLNRAVSKGSGGDASFPGYKGDEVQQLCSSLEMVHRCSPRCVSISFEEVGVDLIGIILHVIERCLDNVIRDDSDVGIVSCLQVLLVYSDEDSGVDSERKRAVKYMTRQPGLMQLLLRVASSDNIIDERGKEVALKIIANLDYSRSGAHKRSTSMTDILLLDTLIENSYHSSADAVRNNAALGLNNLSCHAEYIATMSEEKVYNALIQLLRDDNVLTRQYAASTVNNLAKIKENAIHLVEHGFGALLDELVKIIESDESDETRRSASRALKDSK